MSDLLYDCGSVKRADLRLKAKYYGIKTRIYLLARNHYCIQILNFLDMFTEIKKDFDHSIRNVGDWIELTSQKPDFFITLVEPLSNIAHNHEGISLTCEMLQSLLISRFPYTSFVSIRIEHQNGPNLLISVADDANDADAIAIQLFIQEMNLRFVSVTVKKDSTTKTFLSNKNVQLACTDKDFPFSITDSEFWFDNVEKIYSSEIHKDNLRFYDGSATKCYMDFSVWDNENINIRSNALLYDTIYMSFPLGDHIVEFLQQQHLCLADLEEMVARNKLVILLPNSESRYDRKIIDRLYQVNQNAVVSKRGINALMAMFYCELERKYLSFWAGSENLLEALCEDCIKSPDTNAKMLYDFLTWPIKAKQDSYELLTSFSPIKLPSIGANRILESINRQSKATQDIDFELTVNSNSIHIATALQATYFPFATNGPNGIYSDVTVASVLGNIINAYQYAAGAQQRSITAYGEMLEKERKSIYLLKSNNSVSLKHMLDYADKYRTPTTLKKILEDLSKLDVKQQCEKISEYNNLIAEIGKEKIGTDSFLSYILTGAGFLPVLGIPASIISLFLQIVKDMNVGKKLALTKIEHGKASTTDEVYLLDKLSRVAKLSNF